MKKIIKKIINFFGYNISPLEQKLIKKHNIFVKDEQILNVIENFKTITTNHFENFNLNSKHLNTIYATKYVLENNIKGDFVECGVYKGFMVGLIIETIKIFGTKKDFERKIFLYDTFTGMTNPSEYDFKPGKLSIENNYKRQDEYQRDGYNLRCYYPLDLVQKYLNEFKYDNLEYIKGDVMETIPNNHHKNEKISLLRLDTDFYNSTKHELEYLYSLVSEKGVVISDDYGTWAGAKKACDEFFEMKKIKPLQIATPNSDFVWIK